MTRPRLPEGIHAAVRDAFRCRARCSSQQQQAYAPYRPEPNRSYGAPQTPTGAGGPQGPYAHYDQDTYYHADNSGDVGMAYSRSDAYGPPSYSSPPSYPLRQVDSLDNSRPAQGKDFI